jgi:hypothetical protein
MRDAHRHPTGKHARIVDAHVLFELGLRLFHQAEDGIEQQIGRAGAKWPDDQSGGSTPIQLANCVAIEIVAPSAPD